MTTKAATSEPLVMPTAGDRWTCYNVSHRVAAVWPTGRWNRACWVVDEQHSLVAWSSDSCRSYRPTERGDRMCSKEECE